MKLTPRFMVRAALVLAAAGTIGAFGACKSDSTAPPPPPPPPPPPTILAPTGLAATAASGTRIDLAWTDNATNETGYRVERCSGAACSNFAQIGANTDANAVAFADTFGVVTATSYSYRVRAFNATDSSAFSTTATVVTGSPPPAGQVMIGAGEITTCSGSLGTAQTATLVQNQVTADPSTIVFTLGNNVGGTADGTYASCGFDASWGKFKTAGNLKAAVGDGDYDVVGPDGVYAYFGGPVAPNGYYSFDVGANWHVIVLNTNTWQSGACGFQPNGTTCTPGTPTPMLDWLAADLAANTKACVMAISWERRLYTSGAGALAKNFNMNVIAQMLYGAGVDILLSAQDKQYERFPKLNVDGAADAHGFAQFIVGTGGRSLDAMHAASGGNPVAAQFGGQGNAVPDSWGVVKFTLNANSYDWAWVGTNPTAFSDSGTQACN